jgi:hypothetical protein
MLVSVRAFMADRVNEQLSNQIRLGNDKYVVYVDGKETYHRNAMYFAKKNINVNFNALLIVESADIVAKTMQRMLRKYYPEPKSSTTILSDKKRVVTQVQTWLCERGKPSKEIVNTKDVELSQGQFIAVTVKWPHGQYNPLPLANFISKHNSKQVADAKRKKQGRKNKDNSGSGFYQKTAEAVRRRLRAKKGRGVVQVFARRINSPNTTQPLGSKRSSGHPRPIPRDLGEQTAWAIIVRIRENKGQILGGG